MVAVVTALSMLGRKHRMGSTLLVAAFAIWVFDPWFLFGASGWLSFAAVAIIWLTNAGYRSGYFVAMLRTQLALLLFMLPFFVVVGGVLVAGVIACQFDGSANCEFGGGAGKRCSAFSFHVEPGYGCLDL